MHAVQGSLSTGPNAVDLDSMIYKNGERLPSWEPCGGPVGTKTRRPGGFGCPESLASCGSEASESLTAGISLLTLLLTDLALAQVYKKGPRFENCAHCPLLLHYIVEIWTGAEQEANWR